MYTYTNIWDANKIFGCDCDERYHGSDCSLRNCPVGDDPLTGKAIGEKKKISEKSKYEIFLTRSVIVNK